MKSWIAFVLGAAVGAVAGFLTAKQLLETKSAEIAVEEEEILSGEDIYNARKAQSDAEVNPPPINRDDIVGGSSLRGPKVNSYDNAKTRYNLLDYGAGHPDNVVEEKDVPFVIDAEDYGYIQHYDTERFIYYVGNNVLVDDNNEVIEDVNGLVGYKNLEVFKDLNDPGNHVIFVRNHEQATDYEICADLGSFDDASYWTYDEVEPPMSPRENQIKRMGKKSG